VCQKSQARSSINNENKSQFHVEALTIESNIYKRPQSHMSPLWKTQFENTEFFKWLSHFLCHLLQGAFGAFNFISFNLKTWLVSPNYAIISQWIRNTKRKTLFIRHYFYARKTWLIHVWRRRTLCGREAVFFYNNNLLHHRRGSSSRIFLQQSRATYTQILIPTSSPFFYDVMHFLFHTEFFFSLSQENDHLLENCSLSVRG
jgi:hypothetical protein